MKPFSQACENNKQPILDVLNCHLAGAKRVLEVGSGTGQHAVFFAEHLPHLVWQPTEQQMHISGLNAWLSEYRGENLADAIVLDVDGAWLDGMYDAVFSANTAHIMSWSQVQRMFEMVGQCLDRNGFFLLYGPFNYAGQYTSSSNANFDQWLKARDSLSGIRDFERLNELATNQGLVLKHDHDMPANNRTLVWQRQG